MTRQMDDVAMEKRHVHRALGAQPRPIETVDFSAG
jgi:hypothetical protein